MSSIFQMVIPGAQPDQTLTAMSPEQAAQAMLAEEDAASPAENEPPASDTPPKAVPEVEATEQPPAEDAEETPETEQQESEPAEEQDAYVVKIDGEEHTVTLDELLKGYSRTGDYTRKTQALADERKTFESNEVSAVRTEREQIAAALRQYEEWAKSQTPQEPDWATMQVQEPERFRAEWPVWQYHKEQMRALADQRAAAEAKVAEDRKTALAQLLKREEAETVKAIPEWKDAAVKASEWEKMTAWALSQGYTAEDVEGSRLNHRNVSLLRKAYLYDEAQAKKPEIRKTISKVKVAAPGTTPAKAPVTELTRLRQSFAKTGDIRTYARIMELEGSV